MAIILAQTASTAGTTGSACYRIFPQGQNIPGFPGTVKYYSLTVSVHMTQTLTCPQCVTHDTNNSKELRTELQNRK